MSTSSSGVRMRTLDGGEVTLSEEVLQAFRASFRGPIVRPGDTSYDATRAIWNAMIDRRPALIAQCTGTTDVVRAVQLAKQHRLLLSVRGGGHNIAGLALADGGLVIDLSLLKGVWVDPAGRTARAQAGCTLGDVDRETQLHGLAAVLGFVSTTGIAGLTVGGGFGYLTRRHGWTCDNVVSLEVVTADARVLRCSATENGELFWALRGGGGNFGIVTSFEYALYPCGPEIVGGAIAWRGADAPAVLRLYQEITRSSSRDLTCVAVLRTAPPAPWLPKEIHGQPIAALFVCHTGAPEDGERAVAPIKAFGAPVADIIGRRPYAQMQTLLDATQPKGRRYYWKSEYTAGLSPQLLEVLVAHQGRLRSPHSALILFQLDGALNELPRTHSPAGNRDAAYVVNITASWEDAADDAANVGWARDAWQAARPFSTGGVYVNFLTEDEGPERTASAYGAEILETLAALKRRYDPDDLFRHTKRVTGA
jgi:FAD/FMN-containing dehydrogenase